MCLSGSTVTPDLRAEEAARAQVVVAAVPATVFDRDRRRDRPPIEREELADVAAAVGGGGERRGIPAEVVLRAVGVAESVDVRGLRRRATGTRRPRSTTTSRPDSSPRAPTSRRPASARQSPCTPRRAAAASPEKSSPGPNAPVVSRLTSPENGRSVKNVVARLAAESIARPKSEPGRDVAVALDDGDDRRRVLEDAALDVAKPPGRFVVRMIVARDGVRGRLGRVGLVGERARRADRSRQP